MNTAVTIRDLRSDQACRLVLSGTLDPPAKVALWSGLEDRYILIPRDAGLPGAAEPGSEAYPHGLDALEDTDDPVDYARTIRGVADRLAAQTTREAGDVFA